MQPITDLAMLLRSMREPEGLSVIVPETAALRAGLPAVEAQQSL